MCQGATAATRRAAFPSDADPLDPRMLGDLAPLRTRLGWRDRAVAAPSRAAQDTAAALVAEVVREPALRDADYGIWTGQPMVAIEAADPENFARWLGDPAAAPHGGESLADVCHRVTTWLDACAAAPENRLAVVPPLVLRALVLVALDLPVATVWRLDAGPLGVSRLTTQGGRWRLACFNAAP